MFTPIPPDAPKPKRLRWMIPALAVGALAFLALAYYGIGFILTRQINAQYAGRDCASLVETAGYVERFYPTRIASFTDPAREQAAECAAYLKADSLYEKRQWKTAYDSYLAYRAAYPNGIYVTEAGNFAAASLYELASEQRQRQDFAGAVNNLTLVLEKFSGTPSLSKTKAALPEVYLEWGQECRAEEEFAEAETVYFSLTAWAGKEGEQTYLERAQAELAQTYFDWGKKLQGEKDFSLAASKFDKAIASDPDPKSANRINAQTELARTYFDWGMDLQTKKDYSQAAIKFDKAIAADPNPTSSNSSAAKTRAHLPGFQRAWGEYLITQGKYSDALQHFRISVRLSAPKDVESAQNALSQAYLKWAESLRKAESYHQALEKIDEAQEAAATDDSRKSADDARSNTLDLFSKSKGSEAQKIIAELTDSLCKNGKPLETLPIVGVLDEKRLTLSGVKLTLPENTLANTPGALHFVACVEQKETTLQTCPYSKTGFGIASYWIKRIRYEWRVTIYRSQNGNLFKQKTFQGSSPKSCPWTHYFGFSNTDYFYGDKPSASAVKDWLVSLLK